MLLKQIVVHGFQLLVLLLCCLSNLNGLDLLGLVGCGCLLGVCGLGKELLVRGLLPAVQR